MVRQLEVIRAKKGPIEGKEDEWEDKRTGGQDGRGEMGERGW